MRRFDLVEPTTLEEACGLIGNNDDAKVIAGGTALLTLIKHGIFVPKTLVNLKKTKAASDISYDAQTGLCIGALAAIYDVEASPLVRQHCAMARGERLTHELIERIAADANRNVDPIDDFRGTADYKHHLVRVLVPPSIAPNRNPSIPPLGTSNCWQDQVLNPYTRRYEWQRVCR